MLNLGMALPVRTVPISVFKARCLALLDEVSKTGGRLRVTRRGRALADVVPAAAPGGRQWIGSLQGKIKFHGDIAAPVIDPMDIEALR